VQDRGRLVRIAAQAAPAKAGERYHFTTTNAGYTIPNRLEERLFARRAAEAAVSERFERVMLVVVLTSGRAGTFRQRVGISQTGMPAALAFRKSRGVRCRRFYF
jgi:hypothetical protein